MRGMRGQKRRPAAIPPQMTAVGERLLSLRLAAGLTERELADVSGVSHQMIQKLERGERNTTIATLHALAIALGVDLELRLTNAPARAASPAPAPDRLTIAGRIIGVLSRLPDDRVDALLNEIALWESKYPPHGE